MNTGEVHRQSRKARSRHALTPPLGFAPANPDDFTDRLDGWVGPTIVDPEGMPMASATWTPEGELKRYINEDMFPDTECPSARAVLVWLDALISEAADTCPIEGCTLLVFEHDEAGTHVFPGQWIESSDETVGPLLNISPTNGPSSAGASVEIPLELFESLGATVGTEAGTLSLCGSIDAMAEIFAALAEAGTKGSALLAEGKIQAPALTPRTSYSPRRYVQTGVPAERRQRR
ncbi:hypothetical protein GCM10027405_05450 [Arthrobacter alkaliphilus]|uniref:hypothetical protein n=1 Tax=Arthrobacter alkaliphilus TaxID=369936 RepID=UPI001F253EE5|nr:hypothetical protein [Arthrobacter alkaliphilus]